MKRSLTIGVGILLVTVATVGVFSCGGGGSSGSSVEIPDGIVFTAGEGETASPQTVEYTTAERKVDVFFDIDTTGSMGGELDNLQSSFQTIVAALQSEVDDIAFGAGHYEDYPTDSYTTIFGVIGVDQPFRLKQRISTNSPDTLAGLNAMTLGNGGDQPESGWEALYQIATGAGVPVTVGGSNVPAFDPSGTPPGGVEWGTIGGVGFRSGSLPIVIWVTDAGNHTSFSFSGATSSNAFNALNSINARVIGVRSGSTEDVTTDTINAATTTGAVVELSVWDGVRPAGCGADQCCTGLNGAGVASNSGLCPLVFEVAADGAGLGNAVVTGITSLVASEVVEITAIAVDDLSDSVDAVLAFIETVEADTSAGGACASGMTAIDTGTDGIDDTFLNVGPGQTICFKIIPKTNNTVPATSTTQIFKVLLGFYADDVTVLHEEEIFFVVPSSS